ncbi:ribosome maturation factor RimP [Peptoniphilus olsenii]|uniref:Ribosome maturation factor RimP n=1 Tax=Peptoniphilus olsenii TaxID=411570 RepID=A0ABV2J6X2_9FIRM
MKKSEVLKTVYPIAEETAVNLNYEIVDIDFIKGTKHDLLTIYIYKKDGIDLNDCADMSREINSKLDNLDFLDKPYYLEISSPGLDRPLKTKDDYRRNIGNELDVKLYAPLNGNKIFNGILADYDDENIYLDIRDESEDINIKIPIKSISSMKQTIKF